MGEKKVTIRDVAQMAGVSIATVSQILNGKAQNFNPITVKKVQQAKQKLGYEADLLARQMVGKQSKIIGIVVPEITNPFFNTLVKGIEEVLSQAGFITMLCNGGFNGAKEEKGLLDLAQRGVDGFIIASPSISDELLKTVLHIKKRPYLVLDQKTSAGKSDELATDDLNGGNLAATYLQQMGHTEVAVVVPKNATENINQRVAGFLNKYPHAKVLLTELSKEGGQKIVSRLLTTKVSAVFALNDELAFGIYLGLKQKEKSIPEDMSVIGYDNIDMCRYVTPALTTIEQPIYELGQQAAKILLDRVKEPKKPYIKQILPVRLIERDSVKKNI